MRRFIFFYIFIVLFALVCAALAVANPDNKRFAVMIVTTDGRQGSGVVVEQGILTAAHVVADQDVLLEQFPDGHTAIGHVIKIDKDLDLGLITIEGYAAENKADIGCVPNIGDRLFVIGSGAGLPFSVKYGSLANIDDRELYLDLNVYPGDSGSPVFNEDDEVVAIINSVGICNFGKIYSPSYGRACYRIKEFLSGPG